MPHGYRQLYYSFKTKGVYKDFTDNIEKRFNTSNYEVNRPLPTGKNKKVIGLIKGELGGKIITEFLALRPKTYSYLMDDGSNDKKAKEKMKYVIKKDLSLMVIKIAY